MARQHRECEPEARPPSLLLIDTTLHWGFAVIEYRNDEGSVSNTAAVSLEPRIDTNSAFGGALQLRSGWTVAAGSRQGRAATGRIVGILDRATETFRELEHGDPHLGFERVHAVGSEESNSHSGGSVGGDAGY